MLHLPLRRPATEPFALVLGRLVVARMVFLVALAVPLVLGQQLAPSWSSQPMVRPIESAPAWSSADSLAFPGCMPTRLWDEDQVPSALVVHRYADERHLRLDLDTVWRINRNATETDDLYVIGSCR